MHYLYKYTYKELELGLGLELELELGLGLRSCLINWYVSCVSDVPGDMQGNN